MHCPLEIKRVGKPFIFIDARITNEASVRPTKVAKITPVKYIAINNKKVAEAPKETKETKTTKAAKATKAVKTK